MKKHSVELSSSYLLPESSSIISSPTLLTTPSNINGKILPSLPSTSSSVIDESYEFDKKATTKSNNSSNNSTPSTRKYNKEKNLETPSPSSLKSDKELYFNEKKLIKTPTSSQVLPLFPSSSSNNSNNYNNEVSISSSASPSSSNTPSSLPIRRGSGSSSTLLASLVHVTPSKNAHKSLKLSTINQMGSNITSNQSNNLNNLSDLSFSSSSDESTSSSILNTQLYSTNNSSLFSDPKEDIYEVGSRESKDIIGSSNSILSSNGLFQHSSRPRTLSTSSNKANQNISQNNYYVYNNSSPSSNSSNITTNPSNSSSASDFSTDITSIKKKLLKGSECILVESPFPNLSNAHSHDKDNAKKNDIIILSRLEEAKALNRREGINDGATMYHFSLWDKKLEREKEREKEKEKSKEKKIPSATNSTSNGNLSKLSITTKNKNRIKDKINLLRVYPDLSPTSTSPSSLPFFPSTSNTTNSINVVTSSFSPKKNLDEKSTKDKSILNHSTLKKSNSYNYLSDYSDEEFVNEISEEGESDQSEQSSKYRRQERNSSGSSGSNGKNEDDNYKIQDDEELIEEEENVNMFTNMFRSFCKPKNIETIDDYNLNHSNTNVNSSNSYRLDEQNLSTVCDDEIEEELELLSVSEGGERMGGSQFSSSQSNPFASKSTENSFFQLQPPPDQQIDRIQQDNSNFYSISDLHPQHSVTSHTISTSSPLHPSFLATPHLVMSKSGPAAITSIANSSSSYIPSINFSNNPFLESIDENKSNSYSSHVSSTSLTSSPTNFSEKNVEKNDKNVEKSDKKLTRPNVLKSLRAKKEEQKKQTLEKINKNKFLNQNKLNQINNDESLSNPPLDPNSPFSPPLAPFISNKLTHSSHKLDEKVTLNLKKDSVIEESSISTSVNSLPLAPFSPPSSANSSKKPSNSDKPSPLKWKKGEMIGEGTFGKVFKGLNEKTGELLAIKQIYLLEETNKKEIKNLMNEIKIMYKLNHKNIVKYYGITYQKNYFYIILEYVTGGSLANMIKNFGAFSETLVRKFSAQILCGLNYLHANGIIHRDIKGGNILLTDYGVIKLSDFGCSKQLNLLLTSSTFNSSSSSLEESMMFLRGSVPWMAPEVVKQISHRRSADIWSFGATVIEMSSGHPPFHECDNNMAAFFQIASITEPPKPPEHLSSLCISFLKHCMAMDPDERWTAYDLLTKDEFLKPELELASIRESITPPLPSLNKN